jgi:hypothetical protein
MTGHFFLGELFYRLPHGMLPRPRLAATRERTRVAGRQVTTERLKITQRPPEFSSWPRPGNKEACRIVPASGRGRDGRERTSSRCWTRSCLAECDYAKFSACVPDVRSVVETAATRNDGGGKSTPNSPPGRPSEEEAAAPQAVPRSFARESPPVLTCPVN